jgi:hypothetical protein
MAGAACSDRFGRDGPSVASPVYRSRFFADRTFF